MAVRRTSRQGRWQAKGAAGAVLLSLLCLPPAVAAVRHPQQQPPAPIERRPPSPPGLPSTAPTGSNGVTDRVQAAPIERRAPLHGEHLAQWMAQHSNLTPDQQREALEQEPGFHTLPSETQERYLNRLSQLNAMNPAQRQRRLANIEAMERLTPEQRADVRGALTQLGALPADQRMTVARTFNTLRRLPPDQRVAAFSSGRFGPPLDPNQRNVLMNLLRVEPILPPAPRNLQRNAAPPIQTVQPLQPVR